MISLSIYILTYRNTIMDWHVYCRIYTQQYSSTQYGKRARFSSEGSLLFVEIDHSILSFLYYFICNFYWFFNLTMFWNAFNLNIIWLKKKAHIFYFPLWQYHTWLEDRKRNTILLWCWVYLWAHGMKVINELQMHGTLRT